jgi:WD40 repeat protein
MRHGSPRVRALVVLALGLLLAGSTPAHAQNDVLVVDRMTSTVWRYGANGSLLGPVVQDTTNLTFAGGGVALSPNGQHLYVSNRAPARIVRYDFNGTTASNPLVVESTAGYPLANLAGLTLSPDGNTLYAGGDGGVARFSADLQSTLPKLLTGAGPQANSTAVTINPNNDLLALTTATTIVRYDTGTSAFVPFASNAGVGAMQVHTDDLYVVGAFFPTLKKFDAVTGSPDASFGTAGSVATDPFPASIAVAPDNNNSLLVGILTNTNGAGWINRYGVDGSNQGIWANHVDAPNPGFQEATGLLVVPEPSSLMAFGAAASILMMRGRKRR